MFGIFSRKKKDAKPADKSSVKGKGGTPKKAVTAKDAPKDAAPAPTKSQKKAEAKPDSLKAAIAALEGDAPPPPPAEKISAGAQLDKAKDALAKKAAGGPMDREALIKQALAIQQTQAKMLDKLPEEARLKLRALAMKTFVIDKPTDKKKMN